MYAYEWDTETGGYIITSTTTLFSKEPRPVYFWEMDALGFNKHWNYDHNELYPYMWAETNRYWYRGKLIAQLCGGSLYQEPKLVLLEDAPEEGYKFIQVNIPLMVEKNRETINAINAQTVKKIYNRFIQAKEENHFDIAYVAFSGGKDSVVVLDLVQQALPHSDFKVVFGNTDMEFPTTLEIANQTKEKCKELGIDYLEASAEMPSSTSWKLFGPPARKIRWCCTVHKTAPVINTLCKKYDMKRIRALMITGVRGDESANREAYDEFSVGKKLAGQFSFHPIKEWSSAEIYLQIFTRGLPINKAYKYGFNRVGCIMCPNSSEKHEFLKRKFFPELVDEYCERIVNSSSKDLSGNNRTVFLDTGGWKTRMSGRELCFNEEERFSYSLENEHHVFTVRNLNANWVIWYRAMGKIISEHPNYFLEFEGVTRRCNIIEEGSNYKLLIENLGNTKNTIDFIYLFKAVLAKAQYCIQCGACVAVCSNRNIIMEKGTTIISDRCVHCHECLKIENGCLYYNSVRGSTKMGSLKGINKYLSIGVNESWIADHFKDDNYEPGARKTDTMYALLRDGGIIGKGKKDLTPLGYLVKEKYFDRKEQMWALMLCNLVYTSAFKWYIQNIPFDEAYFQNRLMLDMGTDTTEKAKNEFWNGFKIILCSNEALQNIGFGQPDIIEKAQANGEIKKSMMSILREPWSNPDPLVILYSLYKFAEACGGYYQFTLSTLMDSAIERDGISPTEIFGLSGETMEKLLNGLSINHEEFIKCSFKMDLDSITLREDKTSQDVLTLFA